MKFSGKQMEVKRNILSQLLFYCCNKTIRPGQILKVSIDLGLWFQRVRAHNGGAEAQWQVAGAATTESSCLHPHAGGKESTLGIH